MNTENIFLVIIVLYKKELVTSPTYQSLKKAIHFYNKPVNIFVYDNSPTSSKAGIINDDNLIITYFHDGVNEGLSKAYNQGVKIAKDKKINWLLLLDQDTVIPTNYLNIFYDAYCSIKYNDVVCAIPKVFAPGGTKIISPIKIYYGAIFQSFKTINPGILMEKVTGINSGTFLSVKFVETLGGFDNRFPLDMLDHWYFSEIAKNDKKVWLLNTAIYHDLSVNSFETEMSPDRYESILYSERIFSQKNVFCYLVFKLRLIKRLLQQISYKEKTFFYMTLKNLM